MIANGPAVSFVGAIPTQGSASPLMLPSRNLSKANPRRVWRGFCHHDRHCKVRGSLLMLNMFRGESTVIDCISVRSSPGYNRGKRTEHTYPVAVVFSQVMGGIRLLPIVQDWFRYNR